MELSNDTLKLEQELEQVINSSIDINEKTNSVKLILSKIVTTEASIAKFTSMINNNNNLNQENEKE